MSMYLNLSETENISIIQETMNYFYSRHCCGCCCCFWIYHRSKMRHTLKWIDNFVVFFYYIATYHKQLQQIMWWVLKSCVYVVFTETGLKCDTTKQKSHSFVSHKSPVFNRKTFKTVDIVVVLMILNQIHS